MFLPSGKKVFVITSLVFSAVYQSFKLLQDWSQKLIDRITPKPPVETPILPTPDVPETPVAHH
jgi:hypothetical protein